MLTERSHSKSSNRLGSAEYINLGTGTAVQTGWVGRQHSSSYYAIRLSQRSSLNITASKLKSNADLYLLDQAGKVLQQSTQAGTASESLQSTLKPGTYYVKVARRGGKTTYRLKLTTDAALNSVDQPVQARRIDRLIQQVVKLTNLHRKQAGLEPLQLNSKLSDAALAHSQDMATNDFFDHVSFNGGTLFDRLNAAGYEYASAGENIAAGFATPKAVVQAWMNSPHHRANILTPFVKEIGVGFVFLPNDAGNVNLQYYWTQDFGIPAS